MTVFQTSKRSRPTTRVNPTHNPNFGRRPAIFSEINITRGSIGGTRRIISSNPNWRIATHEFRTRIIIRQTVRGNTSDLGRHERVERSSELIDEFSARFADPDMPRAPGVNRDTTNTMKRRRLAKRTGRRTFEPRDKRPRKHTKRRSTHKKKTHDHHKQPNSHDQNSPRLSHTRENRARLSKITPLRPPPTTDHAGKGNRQQHPPHLASSFTRITASQAHPQAGWAQAHNPDPPSSFKSLQTSYNIITY